MQASNIVVKDGLNTNATFLLISPAAGLGGIAQWALRKGPISAVFPTLSASANQTKGSGMRTAMVKFKLPSSYTDTVTGLTNVGSHAEVNLSVKIPQDFPEALKGDLEAFSVNLIGSDIIRSMVRDATPAT